MNKLFCAQICLLIFLFGCASDEAHRLSIGKNVVVVSEVAPSCVPVGEVYAASTGKGDELKQLIRFSRNQLRNEAAFKEGDHVVIQTNNTAVDSGKVFLVLSGFAYRCSKKLPTPSATPAIPVEPDTKNPPKK